ncbi:ketopantoate reductase family protein [Streptococcus chenjunshii]|uniref:Ketopantoate reductase family protein n=1 Tax=Streptococcus chenjunshii TaxID=2173853 RepID=A0A372KKL3_9STRE|nr:2-dehydropantoate 2-reductase N-terminal domain-containing protein [Streptococcus chenjunshii]AXQ77656.1 ketopantoate reductase family protein [Streptococcus chenjunshii]RFU50679.1 ketopantoate reductase family protein [Streptococcus chenjunshii]RFU52852.1 ketopantoate reductase family protein [Streptococcus chenjunshii]
MKICILGLGVIGTTYGHVFQQAGHQVEHLVRDGKTVPEQLTVDLLDGRYSNKGEEKRAFYHVHLAQPDTAYDFIFLSVRNGKVNEAVETLRQKKIRGNLVIFCNFWMTGDEIAELARDYNYVIGFPTAGGHLEGNHLEAVLFDHVMLDDEKKTAITNYQDLKSLLQSADIKVEVPYDMVEWIWIHMAINAGVTSTAAGLGHLDNPQKLAVDLMKDSQKLALAVKVIRETTRVTSAYGVDLKRYRGELLPYKLPAWLAGKIMKAMFASNQLTRRIMTLHNDKDDIFYGCQKVYSAGKKAGVSMPLFTENIKKLVPYFQNY